VEYVASSQYFFGDLAEYWTDWLFGFFYFAWLCVYELEGPPEASFNNGRFCHDFDSAPSWVGGYAFL
jgi:hypothetical protein